MATCSIRHGVGCRIVAANVSLCDHDSVSPYTAQGRVQHVPAGKRPPQDTRLRPSRGTAPHRKSRPAAQRSGGHRRVATRKATRDPAPMEERATQRARRSSVWDTDRVRPKSALVQANVLGLHEPTGW